MKPVSDRENGSCHSGLGAAVIIAVMLSVIVIPGGVRAAIGCDIFSANLRFSRSWGCRNGRGRAGE